MMIKNKLALLTAIFLSTAPLSATAYDEQQLSLGLEFFDWNDADNSNDDSFGGNIEYRSADSHVEDLIGLENISLIAGADISGKKDVYGYAGLLYDWNFYDDFSLVPSVAAGFYHQDGGQDLGGSFNFRTAIELNYAITQDSRIGIAVSHISNASLYNDNPGIENATISYSFAF